MPDPAEDAATGEEGSRADGYVAEDLTSNAELAAAVNATADPGSVPVSAASRPGRLRAAGRLLRRHRAAAAAGAALVVCLGAGAGVALAATGGGHAPAPKPVHTYGVLAPADGALSVAGKHVPQLAGLCDTHSCAYRPPTNPVTVLVPASGLVKVTAGKSAAFQLSSFSLAHPAAATGIVLRKDRIDFTGAKNGSYQVTVTGQPNGGVWQFTAVVTGHGRTAGDAGSSSSPAAHHSTGKTPTGKSTGSGSAAGAHGSASGSPTP